MKSRPMDSEKYIHRTHHMNALPPQMAAGLPLPEGGRENHEEGEEFETAHEHDE